MEGDLEDDVEYEYTRLGDLRVGQEVHVFGVLVDYRLNRKTRGKDHLSMYTIVDESAPNGVLVMHFHRTRDNAIQANRAYDVLRLHRCRVQEHNGVKQLFPDRFRFGGLLLDGGAAPAPKVLDKNSPKFNWGDADNKMMEEISAYRATLMNPALPQPQVPYRSSCKTLAEIDPTKPEGEKRFDVICRVVSVELDGHILLLRIWDGTDLHALQQTDAGTWERVPVVIENQPVSAERPQEIESFGSVATVKMNVSDFPDTAAELQRVSGGSWCRMRAVDAVAENWKISLWLSGISGAVLLPGDSLEVLRRRAACAERVKLLSRPQQQPPPPPQQEHLAAPPTKKQPKAVPDHPKQSSQQDKVYVNKELTGRDVPKSISLTVVHDGSHLVTGLADILASNEFPKRHLVCARVVDFSPRSPDELVVAEGQAGELHCGKRQSKRHRESPAARTLAVQLRLQDGTGQIIVYLFGEEASRFFGSDDPAQAMQILEALSASDAMFHFGIQSYHPASVNQGGGSHVSSIAARRFSVFNTLCSCTF